MRTKKAMMIVLVMMLAFSFSTYAFAEEGKGSREDYHERMKKRMEEHMKELNLTEEQKVQMEAQHEKKHEEMKALYKNIRTTRKALHEELAKETSDPAKIETLKADMKAAISQKIDRKIGYFLEMKKLLTPEQFKTFSESMEKYHGKCKGKGSMRDWKKGS